MVSQFAIQAVFFFISSRSVAPSSKAINSIHSSWMCDVFGIVFSSLLLLACPLSLSPIPCFNLTRAWHTHATEHNLYIIRSACCILHTHKKILSDPPIVLFCCALCTLELYIKYTPMAENLLHGFIFWVSFF